MHIVVIASGAMQNEFTDKPVPDGVHVQLVTSLELAHEEANAYFYLLEEDGLQADLQKLSKLQKPVFVNAVQTTLPSLAPNCIRINAWPGFLHGKAIELAASAQNKAAVESIFAALQWPYHNVPDVVGLISPRVISMIINEAYFALGEEVSSKADIDTAMKLGTGYPFGPFEWSEKIGLRRIHDLLNTLAQNDSRYQPAPLLTQETEK